ncbi:MAG: rod shape-determining protein MreD, partial [Lachnospiraceae bacterium]|nr:rod shape-determining protein MreD [Lachnospiraceae bacterium]
MELWFYVRRVLIILVTIIGGFLLQCSVFSAFDVAGVVPNVLLIIVSVYGFTRGSATGSAVGFACGILLDIFGSAHFGLFTLIYLLVGYFNGIFKAFFYGSDLKLPLLFIGLSDLLYGSLMFLALFLLEQRFEPSFYFPEVVIPETVYTLAVAVFLYYPMYNIDNWLDNSEKRGS